MFVEKDSLLQLEGIRKIFSKGIIDEVKALDDIRIDIYSRDFVSIIGSNGAGKTTLLNVIAGVFPPERGGRIFIHGQNVTGLSEHKRAAHVGRVYQNPNIGTAGKLTIEENLALAVLRGRKRGIRAGINKQRRERFRDALARLGLGLENRLKTPAGFLSSGQRQALALVMATISRPALLLLDEHTANLDPRTAKTVLHLTDLIVERETMTTMMVTHNMELALHYGNRLIMMHKGRFIVDIEGEDKKNLTIKDLVTAFERAAGEQMVDESILLSCAEA
jgi:putative tryptophan/tyrosine transport system ATP-binding protein